MTEKVLDNMRNLVKEINKTAFVVLESRSRNNKVKWVYKYIII